MVRVNKAFVGLLVVYILTVVILLNVLRSSQSDTISKIRVVDVDNGIIEKRGNSEKYDDKGDESSGDTRDRLTNEGDNSEASQRYRKTTIEDKGDVDTVIRYGPGENGSAVIVSDLVKGFMNKTEFQQRRNFHGFNTFMSDLVSLQRKVEDPRPEACKRIKYPDNMEPASVVIIYRDEWPSVVLRTVYSVLGNSPSSLLKEVVLVDDGSKDQELKAKIAIHVANVEKLKLVQNPSPLGLMLARQKGIEATTAEYFVVMDGHMEVAPGWLEPLIARLQDVPKALLCSHVGGVDQDTFAFHVGHVFDGMFPFFDTLTLGQMWAPFSSSIKAARNGSVAPMPMGTVQGMMAVMRKDFFLQLGGFDPGMRQWGSEQMELSIKVWMCGGRVELVPCSKVAHMYR